MHTPLPSWKENQMDWVSWSTMMPEIWKWKVPLSCCSLDLNGSWIWLKLFWELQWNENMVINVICDAALSRLLDWSQFCNQTILSNFGKREKNAKLPSLLTHLQKLQMWASALSLSLDRLPLAPSYLKSCVQIGEINQLSAPGCICKRRSEKILAPESKKASSLQILSSDDMRDGGLGQNSLYWQKKKNVT